MSLAEKPVDQGGAPVLLLLHVFLASVLRLSVKSLAHLTDGMSLPLLCVFGSRVEDGGERVQMLRFEGEHPSADTKPLEQALSHARQQADRHL